MFGILDNPEKVQRSLDEVIYSSRAIANVAHLKGRDSERTSLTRALLSPGRQSFIYGLRGAGKTSLALSVGAAYAKTDNVLVTCAPQMKFGDVIRALAAKMLDDDPLEEGHTTESRYEGGADAVVIKGTVSRLETKSYKGIPTPSDPNEAFNLLTKISARKKGRFCFIIDEFDHLIDPDSHLQFGLLAKLIADSHSPIKFIFCGVADNVQDIFKAHPSTLRLFEPIEVNRLGLQACFDIMTDVERKLGVVLEKQTQIRIAQISDGFPYFIHLITEKTFWQWYSDPNRDPQTTHPRHYEAGLRDASNSAAPELKDAYEAAAHKYALDGELLVWALATGSMLEKQIKSVHHDFQQLYDEYNSRGKPKNCLNQNQISARLSLFLTPTYGNMVRRPRRSYYTFTEKRMRGYARLRAELQGISLRPDHPLIPKPSK